MRVPSLVLAVIWASTTLTRTVFGEQTPGQDQVDRHPGREQPDPLLGAAGRGEDLVDHLEGYEPGQLTQMARSEHAVLE